MNIALVGKTGSGKTEIAERLVKYFRYDKAKSCTTRTRRDGENGDAYDFMTDEEFDNANLVLKTRYCGNRYGIPIERLAGKDKLVLVVDPNGLRSLADIDGFEFKSFFISCCTFKRFSRCIERGDDKETVLNRVMCEPRVYDSLKTDFVVENETDNVWDAVTRVLECVGEVVDCLPQDFTKLESCQQA